MMISMVFNRWTLALKLKAYNIGMLGNIKWKTKNRRNIRNTSNYCKSVERYIVKWERVISNFRIYYWSNDKEKQTKAKNRTIKETKDGQKGTILVLLILRRRKREVRRGNMQKYHSEEMRYRYQGDIWFFKGSTWSRMLPFRRINLHTYVWWAYTFSLFLISEFNFLNWF